MNSPLAQAVIILAVLVVLGVLGYGLWRLMSQLTRTAAQVERAAVEVEALARQLSALRPRIESVLDGATAELGELHQTTAHLKAVAARAEEASAQAASAAAPLLGTLDGLGERLRQVSAIVAAAIAGVSAFRRLRRAAAEEEAK